MSGTQSDFQAAVTAGKGPTDDNEVLSLSGGDLEEIDQVRSGAAITKEVEVDNSSVDTTEVTETEDNQPRTFTEDQVQAIVRQRVANLNKRIEKLETANVAVDKLAEVSGLQRDQLIARLNTMSDDEQAKILGITPQQVSAMRVQRQANSENEKQIKKLNRDLELATLKTDKKYSDIDIFMDDILSKVDEHPSISLKDAYTLVKGELGLTAQIRDAEQRVANSQANAKAKAMANSVGASQATTKKLTEQVVNNAAKVGMDVNKYAAFQNIDNIDAYRAWKKAQKGGK